MANSENARKIDEALQLLNEAAREKKDELKQLLDEKYTNIKSALGEVIDDNSELARQFRKRAGEAFEEGQEHLEEAMADVDREVRRNPWPYIGGAAAAALVLGFLMGSSRR